MVGDILYKPISKLVNLPMRNQSARNLSYLVTLKINITRVFCVLAKQPHTEKKKKGKTVQTIKGDTWAFTNDKAKMEKSRVGRNLPKWEKPNLR